MVEHVDDDGQGIERRIASAQAGYPRSWTFEDGEDPTIRCEIQDHRIARMRRPRMGAFVGDFADPD
jgi:hypothetical protein